MFFISYKHEDIEFAELLAHQISNQEGLTTWHDTHILAGDEWEKAIDNNINLSIGVIVVVTPLALESHYITYEWSYAIGLGKPVIPLIFEYPGDLELHPKLDKRQWIDFRKKPQWSKLFKSLNEINQRYDIPIQISTAKAIIRSSAKRTEWIEAIESLEKDRDPKALDALVAEINNSIPEKSVEVGFAIARKTDYSDDRAIDGLRKGLIYNYRFGDVTEALGRIGGEKASTCLIEGYDSNLPMILHVGLLRALGNTKHKMASVFLQKLAVEKSSKHRTTIFEALGETGDPDAALSLLSILQDYETKPATKVYLANALAKLGNHSIVPELVKITDNYTQYLETLDSDSMFALIGAIGALNTNEGNAALKKYLRNNLYIRFDGFITDELKRNGSL